MQINIEKNLVEFTPENADETAKLQTLWRVLVDCARFNKKMVPVGEYIPQKNAFARFAIIFELRNVPGSKLISSSS